MINLPHDDDFCGWLDALSPQTSSNRLEGHINADYAIIGAGFAGLAAARQLAMREPNARIILLDAQRVAYGASGRNSGFVIDLPHKFALEHPDPEYKQRLLRLNRAAIGQLDSLVKTYHIDCQWSKAGKYQGAVGERGAAFLDHFEHLLKDLGEPFQRVEGQKLAGVLGTQFYRAAIHTPGTFLMQPAALVRGLADHLPQNVELLEYSPVRRLSKNGASWSLHGDHGRVDTPRLLLGTSIFTREFGFLKNRLLPVMTFASWTRPLTDAELETFGGQLDWGLTPADHAGTTLRMTADRRILIRNSYKHAPKYGSKINQTARRKIRKSHRDAFNDRYPLLTDVPFTHTWGGVYSMSRNFSNFFGKVGPSAYASAADNGVGSTWGTISGTLLADLAVGADSSGGHDSGIAVSMLEFFSRKLCDYCIGSLMLLAPSVFSKA